MASIYTYDQFEQAARQAGLFDKFSDADLNLARQNADAGMSILKYKQDYASATTDEARALANLGAENIRSSYGNYTGGQDGGSFHLNPMSPSSFQQGEAPKYESRYDGQVQELWDKQKNYGEFTFDQAAPTYENRYDEQTQQLINAMLNWEQFSYDPATDPSAQAYQKQYAREGKRATQDALAAASLATGGVPSSYAVSAATQAGDYYAAQMADKIPELYQQAYGRYLDEYNQQMQNLGMLQNAEQQDYGKFQDRMNQWNTDRNFAYGQWQDGLNKVNADLQTGLALEQQDYDRFLQDRNQYNADREFGYGQLLDELSSQNTERQEAMDKAQIAGNYGDYSFLNDLGIDTTNNPADWERNYQMALLKAEMGDYSGLQELGIDTSNNPAEREWQYQLENDQWDRNYQMALLKAQYGDYSGLRELGVSIPEESGSGGYYYSGGGNGGGNENENQDPEQEETGVPITSISSEAAQQMMQQYPGLTKEDLYAAGFRILSTGNDSSKGNNRPDWSNSIM